MCPEITREEVEVDVRDEEVEEEEQSGQYDETYGLWLDYGPCSSLQESQCFPIVTCNVIESTAT